MALAERDVVLFIVIMITLQVSYAVVYKVGDSAGWTTLGSIDYKKWAATKNFQIGDTISKFCSLQLHALFIYLCWFLFIVSIRVQIILENWKVLFIVMHPFLRMIRKQTMLTLFCNSGLPFYSSNAQFRVENSNSFFPLVFASSTPPLHFHNKRLYFFNLAYLYY